MVGVLWEIKSWGVRRIWESLAVRAGRGDHGIGVGNAAGNDGNENTHMGWQRGKAGRVKGRMEPAWARGTGKEDFFLPGDVRDRLATSAISAAALWLCVSLILHQTIKKILS